MLIQAERAEQIVNPAFQDAQLDLVSVRSIEMVLTFLNADSSGKLCHFRVVSINHIDIRGQGEGKSGAEFLARRRLLLPELHSLLGEDVASATLDADQRLIVSFSNGVSLIFSNEPEEVFDPLDVNWALEFDDEWERAPGVRSLSCVLSETGQAEFYISAEQPPE